MKISGLFSVLSVLILSSPFVVQADEVQVKVVDAHGKGVARAFVGWEDGIELPAMTDENGECSLAVVAQQDTVLLASSGANLISYRVKETDQDIELVLPEASKIEDKIALADELLKTARLDFNWTSKWDALGTKRIETTLLLDKNELDPGLWAYKWNLYLDQLAERDPKDFLKRNDELLKSTPEERLKNFKILTMIAWAQSDDENERQVVKDWLETQKTIKWSIDIDSVRELLTLAEIHEKLNTTENNIWLNYAVQIAAQLSQNISPYIYDLGTRTSKISPLATELLCQDWTIPQQLTLWWWVVNACAERGDLQNARSGFEKMTALLEQIKKNPDQTVQPVDPLLLKPEQAMDMARQPYAKLLARSDPEAAIELSAPLDGFNRANVMVVAGRTAAQAGNVKLARKAWNIIFETQLGNTELGSQASAAAIEFAPELADEICKKTYSRIVPKLAGPLDFFYPCLATFAKARAKGWAGESRILIEREWKKRIVYENNGEKGPAWDMNRTCLKALVGAMTQVDVARAIEMDNSLNDTQNLRAQAKAEIAYELLKK